MINPEAFSSDAELERRIYFQAGLLATAITREEQLEAQQELSRLIARRSPEMIAAMEEAMGIR